MKLGLALLIPVLVAIAAGCASVAQSSEPEPEATSEDELRACKYPRRYMAVLVTESECTEVVSARGRWVPSPLFPDAPASSGACFYDWSGEKGARVDRAALKEHVGFYGALTPSCGREGIDDADLYQIPPLPVHGMAGSVGCDVCGIHRDGKLWVVIPPERDLERQFEIRLDNGNVRAFQLTSTPGARLLSVTLPPAPPGTQYVNGRVAIY